MSFVKIKYQAEYIYLIKPTTKKDHTTCCISVQKFKF